MYVIDQSVCDGAPYKDSLEQDHYKSPEVSGVNLEFLAPFGASPPPVSLNVSHTMTMATLFDAVHTQFNSDGSWRSGRNTGKTRATRGNGNRPTHGSNHTCTSFLFLDLASERERARSVNMVMLNSSTTEFGERGQPAAWRMKKERV